MIHQYTPKQQRMFFLQQLLLHQEVCTSFEHLRTVNGEVCPTFKAACIAMNLIENDDMWTNIMDDTMNLYTATSCTNFPIAILCENEVVNPRGLFDRYHDFLIKDFLYQHQQQQQQHPHEVALNDLLFTIDQDLQMKDKTNSDMGLPEQNYNLVQQSDLMAELIDPTVETFLENEPKLYEEQHSFLNRVLHLLQNDEDGFLFLDAPGECGKTFV